MAGGEALEMDDEVLRCAGEHDAFRGFALGATARTLPHLIARQPLLGTERTETVADVAFAGAGDLDAHAVKGFVCR